MKDASALLVRTAECQILMKRQGIREAFKKTIFCDKCHTLGGGGAGPCHKKNHSLKIIFKQFYALLKTFVF